jgi:hypothetical protein
MGNVAIRRGMLALVSIAHAGVSSGATRTEIGGSSANGFRRQVSSDRAVGRGRREVVLSAALGELSRPLSGSPVFKCNKDQYMPAIS